MSTGQANRASVLTSALLHGSVAQVHGIPPFFARVVQSRTVRLIHGVALDECHRSGALPDARTNFESLNAKKLERPVALDSRPWLVVNVLCGPDVVESCLKSEAAGGELVKETSQGFE